MKAPPQHGSKTTIGCRIHVIGNSCAGKSTLGMELAKRLNVPFVELDALNWQPGWVGLNQSNPAELERRISEATAGDGWVVAGSYTDFSQRIFWSRCESVIWLDLPMFQLLWRMFRRSWRRWRSKELLWGTNYEKFWPQFMVWRKEESLLWWIVTQHERKRRQMMSFIQDEKWKHITFIQLGSLQDVNKFLETNSL